MWWTLRTFGAAQVFILDGGLPRWRAEGRPVESGEVARPARTFNATFNAAAVAGLAEVRRALAESSAQVLDARPVERFRGEAPEPRPGVRSGHMPGAINVPVTSLIENGRLIAPHRIEQVLTAAGVDLAQPLITSCGSGVTAATLWLALEERMRVAVLEPFADFMRHPAWLAILAFALLYRFGDAILGAMAYPFYKELGFSGTEIAAVSQELGVVARLAGVFVGGLFVARYGMYRALAIGWRACWRTRLLKASLAWPATWPATACSRGAWSQRRCRPKPCCSTARATRWPGSGTGAGGRSGCQTRAWRSCPAPGIC